MADQSYLPVTETAVLGITGAKTLAAVTKLNLFGQGVTHVGVLASETPALRLLSASLNDLNDDALASVCFGCPHLEELYVRGNKVRRPAALAAIKCLPGLSILWIADNPLTAFIGESELRQLLLFFQPCLKIIDNKCKGRSSCTSGVSLTLLRHLLLSSTSTTPKKLKHECSNRCARSRHGR